MKWGIGLLGFLSLSSFAAAQIGECSFYMNETSSHYFSADCAALQPGSESVTWTGECRSDCSSDSRNMSITLRGDCHWGVIPCNADCLWKWEYVGQPDEYHFVASGWDAEQAPCGVCGKTRFQAATERCTSCGHPCWEPVIISLRDEHYRLTDSFRGVWFDLTADGEDEHIPWTHPKSDEVFLVLDRNGNGIIDDGSELFSHVSPQPPPLPGEPPHGFRALGIFDERFNGGNEDGILSEDDAIFEHLHVWQDRDHDGQTDSGELQQLSTVGLVSVALDYSVEGAYFDEFGNDFHFWATATFRDHAVPAWAVFFGSPGSPSPSTD